MKLAVLVLVGVLAATAAQAQGSISGCVVTNVAGAQFAITVTITGPDVAKTTRTNSAGCYSFKNLPPGTYQVAATSNSPKLQDNDTATLGPGGQVALDFGLFTSQSMVAIDWDAPPADLADLWAQADAVVYVRVTGATPRAALQPESFNVTATVLAVLKRGPTFGLEDNAITFSQPRWIGEPTAYASGTEIVLFLRRDTAGRVHRAYGPHAVFNVNAGIVQAPSSYSQYQGMKIEGFLATLRALGKQGEVRRGTS